MLVVNYDYWKYQFCWCHSRIIHSVTRVFKISLLAWSTFNSDLLQSSAWMTTAQVFLHLNDQELKAESNNLNMPLLVQNVNPDSMVQIQKNAHKRIVTLLFIITIKWNFNSFSTKLQQLGRVFTMITSISCLQFLTDGFNDDFPDPTQTLHYLTYVQSDTVPTSILLFIFTKLDRTSRTKHENTQRITRNIIQIKYLKVLYIIFK